jgi:poly(beta-D-mannuronate) lyase
MKLSLSLLLLPALVLAKDIPVANADAFGAAVKQAKPGDTLVLAEGEWKDAVLKFVAEGTKELPITVKASTPGKTILTGASQISFGGHFIHIEGLHFRDPSQVSGEVIEFRKDSKVIASNCVLRDCAVTSSEAVNLGKKTARFVSIYGTGHTIEHCHFEGKTTGGTLMVVWFTPGGVGQHVIRDNYFGPRPALGKNGGETIRIGDSETHDTNAKCEVTGNLFYQCNGEGEIISVKSNENHFAGNTFIECEGALTLRHAHRCLVENNVFIGNHKRQTGGVRIIGEDHVVRGNYFEALEGDGYRSAVCFMKGIPNSPANGYYEVKNVLLEKNTAIDCKVTLSIGEGDRKEASLVPVTCTVKDNIFISPKRPIIDTANIGDGWTWKNNVMLGKSIGVEGLPGVVTTKPEIVKPKSLARSDVGVPWLR